MSESNISIYFTAPTSNLMAQNLKGNIKAYLLSKGEKFPLYEGHNWIGSSSQKCDVVLNHASISRIHASILIETTSSPSIASCPITATTKEASSALLTDMRSRGKTWVGSNYERCLLRDETIAIQSASRIRFGGLECVYHSNDEDSIMNESETFPQESAIDFISNEKEKETRKNSLFKLVTTSASTTIKYSPLHQTAPIPNSCHMNGGAESSSGAETADEDDNESESTAEDEGEVNKEDVDSKEEIGGNVPAFFRPVLHFDEEISNLVNPPLIASYPEERGEEETSLSSSRGTSASKDLLAEPSLPLSSNDINEGEQEEDRKEEEEGDIIAEDSSGGSSLQPLPVLEFLSGTAVLRSGPSQLLQEPPSSSPPPPQLMEDHNIALSKENEGMEIEDYKEDISASVAGGNVVNGDEEAAQPVSVSSTAEVNSLSEEAADTMDTKETTAKGFKGRKRSAPMNAVLSRAADKSEVPARRGREGRGTASGANEKLLIGDDETKEEKERPEEDVSTPVETCEGVDSTHNMKQMKKKTPTPATHAKEDLFEAELGGISATGSKGRRGRKRVATINVESPVGHGSESDPLNAVRGRGDASATRSSQHSYKSDEDVLRVMFTGIEKDEELVRKVKGARLTEVPEEATHVIVGQELRRTPKLMIAINAGVRYVLTIDWLVASAAQGRALPITKNSKYILHDAAKEKLWDFDLKRTLTIPRGPPGIFYGLSVWVTPGVCGVKAPKEDELRAIVCSGGGLWLEEIPSASQPCIVVSSVDALPNVDGEILRRAGAGSGKGVYSLEFLFRAILRQEIRFEEDIILNLAEGIEKSATEVTVENLSKASKRTRRE